MRRLVSVIIGEMASRVERISCPAVATTLKSAQTRMYPDASE
jgi:hypothetical protein